MPKYVDKFAVIDALYNTDGNKSDMLEKVLKMPQIECIPISSIKSYLDDKFCSTCVAKFRCNRQNKRCGKWELELSKIKG